MADFQLNVKLNGVEQAVSTVGELENALKATRQELKGVEVGSEAFDNLSNQARTLQNELKEVKESLNFDKNIGQLGESVSRLGSSVASGFAVATSAIQLFGGDTKELSEAQVKAQLLLNIALGATNVAANAAKLTQDLKNISDAIGLNLTRQNTAATITETSAVTAEAAATEGATVAQQGLNAAMKANPIGIVLTAVTALVAALVIFADEEENVGEQVKINTRQIEDSNILLERRAKLLKEGAELNIELAKLEGRLSEIQAIGEQAKIDAVGKTQQEIYELQKQAIQDEIDLRIGGGPDIVNALLSTYGVAIGELNKSNKEINQEILDGNEGTIAAVEKLILDLGDLARAYREDNDVLSKEDAEKQAKYLETVREALLGNYEALKLLSAEQKKLNKQKEVDDAETLKRTRELWKRTYDKIKGDLKDFYVDVQKIEEDYQQKLFELRNENDPAKLAEREKGIEIKKITDLQALRLKDVEKYKLGEEEKKKVNMEAQQAIDAINAYYLQLSVDRKKEADGKYAESTKNYVKIKGILDNELSYGDQNYFDTKNALLLKQQEFELRLLEAGYEFVGQGEERALTKRDQTYVQFLEERLKLIQKIAKQELDIQKENLRAEAIQREENFKETLEKEVTDKKQRADLLTKFRTENQKQLNDQLAQVDDEYELKKKENAKKTEDEILAYRLQKLQEYSSFAFQGLNQIVGLFSAISEGQRIEGENQLNALRDNLAQQQSAVNESYNAELELLNQKVQQGLITEQQYQEAKTRLDKGQKAQSEQLQAQYQAKELETKKKAFENDKKLKIATTIINGLQGSLTAFTSAMSLPAPASYIVGGIMAALVAATTAVQVANISKTKFDGGSPAVTGLAGGGADTGAGGAANIIQAASSGGFTSFNQSLVGGSPGGGGNTGGSGATQPTKVILVESDVTQAQRRVSMAESNATF